MECSSKSLIQLKGFFIGEKKRIITAIAAVFIWGLVAHAYGFLNLTLSHDSLAEFYASGSDIRHRIALGRFMVPIYQFIFHGRITTPWLNGILSLCWLSVSVWLTASIFSVEDKLHIALIAGIYTVNITVTALAATYIHDLDADIFAVMLSVAAVFFWHKGGKMSLLGIPLLAGALGCYQSMLSVAITLVMFSSILALVWGGGFVEVVLKGLKAVGLILAAGLVYLAAVNVVCHLSGVTLSNSYNGLTLLFRSKGGLKQHLALLLTTYYSWYGYFYKSYRALILVRGLHILLAVPCVVVAIRVIFSRTLPLINKLLIIALAALLPFGMNIACAADGGMVHDLMLYSVNLSYLLVILMMDWYVEADGGAKKLPHLCRTAAFLFLAAILAFDVQTANASYVKKDLERQATLSLMTTVNTDMNNTEGYVPGESEVLFVGLPDTGVNNFFPNVSRITGLGYETTCNYYSEYYQYILQRPLKRTGKAVDSDFINAMPSFPEKGYIAWYDDVLVVKLSD